MSAFHRLSRARPLLSVAVALFGCACGEPERWCGGGEAGHEAYGALQIGFTTSDVTMTWEFDRRLESIQLWRLDAETPTTWVWSCETRDGCVASPWTVGAPVDGLSLDAGTGTPEWVAGGQWGARVTWSERGDDGDGPCWDYTGESVDFTVP